MERESIRLRRMPGLRPAAQSLRATGRSRSGRFGGVGKEGECFGLRRPKSATADEGRRIPLKKNLVPTQGANPVSDLPQLPNFKVVMITVRE